MSSVPAFEPSTRNCTPATPTLFTRFAVTVTMSLSSLPLCGEVMATWARSRRRPVALKATTCMTSVAVLVAVASYEPGW